MYAVLCCSACSVCLARFTLSSWLLSLVGVRAVLWCYRQDMEQAEKLHVDAAELCLKNATQVSVQDPGLSVSCSLSLS